MKKLLIIPALAILIGCGGGGSNTAQIDKDLLGSWSTDCEGIYFSDGDAATYEQETVTFKDDGTFTYKDIYYSDSECSDKTGNQVTDNGTYSAGEEVTAKDGNKAKKLDVISTHKKLYTMYRFEDGDKTTQYVASETDDSNDGSSASKRSNDFEEPYIWHKK